MSLTYVPATLAHVRELLPILREADAREIVSSTGKSPAEALAASVGASVSSHAALDPQGRIIMLLGLGEGGPGLGVPWMVASDLIGTQRVAVARDTYPVIDAMNRQYPVLLNHADTRNALHLRWMKWAGFTFTRTSTEWSVDGTPFVEIVRIRKPPCVNP